MSQYSQIASLKKYFTSKLLHARRQLGMIKSALYWAPERAPLMAYNTLCLPHLEFASAACDPTCKKDIADFERIQINAICFITNTKGRELNGAMEKLSLQPLEQRRKSRRISLLLKILAKAGQHPALSQLQALYRLAPRQGASSGQWGLAVVSRYLNSFFFQGQSGT